MARNKRGLLLRNKRYLLDTHLFLWSLVGSRKLKAHIEEVLTDPRNFIFVSVVAAWEISIKSRKNPNFKLKTSIKRAFEISGFEVLSVTLDHVLELHKLPFHHNDPFDRMLIAQAKAEKLTLITADRKIWEYKIPLLKA